MLCNIALPLWSILGKQDAPSHRRMLKNMMEEIADIKISYGKLDEGMEAIYKDAQNVIRVRNANDWEKGVPLFAKAVWPQNR